MISDLKDDVFSGRLKPGSKLPAEPHLMERFAVSRTVLREAIAELRAQGLVRTVQGAGVFVCDDVDMAESRLTRDEVRSIPLSLEILEYRVGIEVEAAALAAKRKTPPEDYAIREASRRFHKAVDLGERSDTLDLAFHIEIAKASHNSRFVRALDEFGPTAIPRSLLPHQPLAHGADYLKGVAEEHENIAVAISSGDPDAARGAMREHLERSIDRYQALCMAAASADSSKIG